MARTVSTKPKVSQDSQPAPHEIEQSLREKLRRDAIDAAHFFGLAALYEERGKWHQATECLEIAASKNAVNPLVHKLQARLLFRRQDFDGAAAELRLARRFNPFDRETSELQGRVEYERGRYREALEATIDAFLLVEEQDRANGDQLKKRIRDLKSVQRMSSQDLASFFRQRRDKLQTDFDRLDWQRDQLLRDVPDGSDTITSNAIPVGGHLQLANRLRSLELWAALTDAQIFHLSRAARDEVHEKSSKIFDYGSTGSDIYALEEGSIGIFRPTHYGTFHLGTLPPGCVFGEVNFISHAQRSGDAIALERSRILRLDAQDLELVIEQYPEVGVRLYSIFWQDLAKKLRGANDQLRTFFSSEAASENFLKMRAAEKKDTGTVAEVHSDTKIELLREQGLSGAELSTLTNFSDAKRFSEDAYLFHEGDDGHEMYAVLDGRVLISKYIDGGEEALAVLGRGDFFGEMALIDGEPRSADAKAHKGEASVIAFDNETLSKVMSTDPVAALDFMKLLCRLIANRLREIDEKVIGWRIMSGAQPEDVDGHA